MKDRMIELLQKSIELYGDDERPVHQEILGLGDPGLQSLKEVALDNDIDVNIRKEAVCHIAKFSGDGPAQFIAEEFVNGKDSSQLYAAYESGEDQAGFPLFRTAKECLEGLGYRVSRGR